MSNKQIIQQIYEAFGRGDIPTILGHLHEDVEWEYGMAHTDVPWLQHHHGRKDVVGFFESLSGLEFHKFEPQGFFEGGNTVIALIDIELTAKKSGRPIVEEDEVHIWHFNDEGQVVRFCHKIDTYQHWAAYHAV